MQTWFATKGTLSTTPESDCQAQAPLCGNPEPPLKIGWWLRAMTVKVKSGFAHSQLLEFRQLLNHLEPQAPHCKSRW